MKTRKEKIYAIYEKIARKDLSFGCRIILEAQNIIIAQLEPGRVYEDYYEQKGIIEGRYVEYLGEYNSRLKIYNIKFYHYKGTIEDVDEEFLKDFIFDKRNKGFKIIGHPVMLGDVLDYYWDKKGAMTLDRILRFWEKKSASIEEQTDRCVDYIYRLVIEKNYKK